MGIYDFDKVQKMLFNGGITLLPADLDCLVGDGWLSLLLPFSNRLPCGRSINTPQEVVAMIREEPYWVYYTCRGDGVNKCILFHIHNVQDPVFAVNRIPRFFIPYSLIENCKKDITLKDLFKPYKEDVIEFIAYQFGGQLQMHKVPASHLVDCYLNGLKEIRIL